MRNIAFIQRSSIRTPYLSVVEHSQKGVLPVEFTVRVLDLYIVQSKVFKWMI